MYQTESWDIMNTMTKTAIATFVLVGSGLGLVSTADAAPGPSPGCKILSVESQIVQRPGPSFDRNDVQATSAEFFSVKVWTRTVTTLKCRGRVTQAVSLWSPVR